MKPEDRGYAPRYVLMTAAHNEEFLIGRTIESVISQTILPARWVIVSDGSTDRTDEIVRGYCGHHAFIRFQRVDRPQGRGVASKVNALKLAHRELLGLEYDFLGNLDADVSLGDSYFKTLIKRFQLDQTLGITGGMIYEKCGGKFKSRPSNSVTSVAHAAQLLRRKCYEAIGGYVPLKYGGEDWYAEVSARMLGWRVQAFPDLKVFHHRYTGAADRVLRHRFREGKMDFSVGSHPAFELLKCARRIPERPVAIGAFTRFAGFCWSYAVNDARLVSPEFVSFLRREQKHRLKLLLGHSSTPSRGDLRSCQ